MKKKVKIEADWYGAIDEIGEDGIIKARLYETKTNELAVLVEFSIENFPVQERPDVVLNGLFKWRVGLIGKKRFSNFRVIYRDSNYNRKSTEEIQEIVTELEKIFK